MIQGTSSNAGKSSLVAAFCRIFSDKGYKVAPLKAQNMSSNLYFTKDGLEMAKAQAIQAVAARIEPSPIMNPILLKPMGDYVSRVILLGKMYKDMHARHYYSSFVQQGIQYVKQAIKKLSKYDVVVIEGAGSPAEINIMDYDIANMRIAELVNAPVLIVGDIERGGCFASIVGTLRLLKPKHRKLVKGFIINKFRGDKAILDPALTSIKKITRKSVLGIIPFIDDILLPYEDSLAIDLGRPRQKRINIAIIKYPNAVNITDFEPLLSSSGALNTYYVTSSGKLSAADLVLLPSSRNLIDDLKWMKENRIADSARSLRSRKPVIGICEGFAMMGKHVQIDGIGIDGLGLIDTAVYSDRKLAGNVSLMVTSGKTIVSRNGKILHAFLRRDYRVVKGRRANPLFHILKLNGKPHRLTEGAISNDGLAFGCQLYGLFETALIRKSVVEYLASRKRIRVETHNMEAVEFWDRQIQRLSNIVRDNTDVEQIMKLVEP